MPTDFQTNFFKNIYNYNFTKHLIIFFKLLILFKKKTIKKTTKVFEAKKKNKRMFCWAQVDFISSEESVVGDRPYHHVKPKSLHSSTRGAPAGNRTRVCTVAGYYSTTRPLVLVVLSGRLNINNHFLYHTAVQSSDLLVVVVAAATLTLFLLFHPNIRSWQAEDKNTRTFMALSY